MPILKNAKKALRVSERKNIVNRKVKSQVKTAIDQAIKEPSQENLAKASSKIDRAVKKNLIHKNKAARVKSRLAKLKSKSS
ncbi:MAG TPA: 30S ribosomal protein S20 [Candidatus Woesebacteria bacterium]|jgi:small subunit ribosomal protein S20|nr:30S ribosomal protein S20 [Candidatus Woesebacteria bacterium]HOA11888.1 30S ribosomal protein S20 [Candidatus Woesebacteria bacterium]HOC07623.1 30S ribosomal protein S20 [Candidatus Woesebacteria bacterium]HOI04923.1 30S ribosomal protein S20 [Candidatus Woesebacteria bacterium]HOP38983.1 30S ribosomal protein S20 [Candidatus Woesebacteria bacterium]